MISIAHDKFERLLPAVFIKEARQSLCQNAFVIQFAAFHALIAFTALSNITAISSGALTGSPFESEGAFWFIVSIYLLVVAPIFSVNTLSNEINGGTIELMRMTNLSSRQIVYGKWSYQLVYILLMSVSAAPYLLTMQLATSHDFMAGLTLLLSIAVLSCLLTGVAIGASAFGSGRLRPLFLVGLAGFALIGGSTLFGLAVRSRGTVFSMEILLAILGFGIPFALYMIELGAAKIGTELEHGSASSRILGFVMMGAAALLVRVDGLDDFAIFMGVVFLIVLPWKPMLSQPICNAGVAASFRRRGRIWRSLGRVLLYPGWHTGATYVALLLAHFIFGVAMGADMSGDNAVEISYVFVNLAMVPAFFRLLRELLQREGAGFPVRSFVWTVCGVSAFSMLIGLVKLYADVNLMPLAAFNPLSAFLFGLFNPFRGDYFPLQVAVSGLGIVVLLLALWVKGLPIWTRIDALERASEGKGAGSDA